jgi:carbamoyltransferase
MATHVLGISAYYHDSAAALVRDGEIVAAAQEERFTRRKHDAAFPAEAVTYCLREAGLSAGDIDYVVFYDKPLLKFDRLLETYIAYAPRGLRSFMHAIPLWLKTKLHLPREIQRALGGGVKRRLAFTLHHEAHAASAFFPSPFEDAAILTMDGVGEWMTASIGRGDGRTIDLLRTQDFPHSLGLLYSAFTYFCGFKVNSGEYKLMGLAPYGKPRFADLIRERLIDLKSDGSFRLDMRYFGFADGLRMTNRAFEKLFGGPPRLPEDIITEREMDLAASIQQVTEEIVLGMARTAREITGSPRLCMAGGVALNCVANGAILRERIFEEVWVQPASGDAGGALGAALFVAHQLLEAPRQRHRFDAMKGALLGPQFGDESIAAALEEAGLEGERFASEEEFLASVAGELADGKVVGWFHGRMEFGPRALGARSILGDPRAPSMQAQMNLRIKFRESFRPFAPAVLAEDCADYFNLQHSSPYMLLVADVKEARRAPPGIAGLASEQSPNLLERVNVVRSDIPAVTHVDYSARVQTVDERHSALHKLLRAFKTETGCPVLINTSFNVRGEPIVCTPGDAIRCFLATDMDLLAIGSFIVRRPAGSDAPARESHLAKFDLD